MPISESNPVIRNVGTIRMEADFDGGSGIGGLKVNSTRLRVGPDLPLRTDSRTGSGFISFRELELRYDDGIANSGEGLEYMPGFSNAKPSKVFETDVRRREMLIRGADYCEEQELNTTAKYI